MGAHFVFDQVGLARLGRVAHLVAEQVTEDVARDMRRFVPVDTGDLKDSIYPVITGRIGRVFVGTDHWAYPEYGVEPHQRTSAYGQVVEPYIHPGMAAQPYARPAIYRVRPIARVSV